MNNIVIDNGVDTYTFDNTRDGAVLQRYEGFEFPELVEVMENPAGRDGSLFINSRFRQRRFSWQGEILGATVDDVMSNRQDIIRVLNAGELITVKFQSYDDIDLQSSAVLKLVAPYSSLINKFLIEAIAPDWRFYSQTETTSTTGTTDQSGGTAIPTAIPMSLAAETSNKLTVTNNGNEITLPTLTVRGPGTTFTIQNITNGDTVILSLTLTAGESVTIDPIAKTVKQNGYTNVYGNLSSNNAQDWFRLSPGSNEIHFTASTGSTSETELDVVYRDAYRGV